MAIVQCNYYHHSFAVTFVVEFVAAVAVDADLVVAVDGSVVAVASLTFVDLD